MANNPITRAVEHHLQRLTSAPKDAPLSDGQLLEQFLLRHDEDSFQELVRRHGAMVLGLCRRALHDPHLADDAFQATFLTLVRKGDTIAQAESVGSWLHGVAYRIASRARVKAERQRSAEPFAAAAEIPAREVGDGLAWQEVRWLLDQELNGLPHKYRAPLVLHYLEGQTNHRVARQLRWREGTVKTRLAKGRDLLRQRLVRRGLALSAAVFEAHLGEEAQALPVTASLTTITVRGAVGVAAGQAPAAPVSVLMNGALKEMWLSKVKLALSVLVMLGLVAGAAVGLLPGAAAEGAGEQPSPGPSRPAAPTPLPPELDLVPRDVSGFVSLRMDGLWDGPLGKALARQAGDQGPTVDLLLAFLGDDRTVLDPLSSAKIPIASLDRLTLVALGVEIPLAVALVATFTKPYDEANILRKFQGEQKAERHRHMGKTYLVHGPAALHFVNDRTLIVGQVRGVSSLLAAPKKNDGPLLGALRLASRNSVVVGYQLAPLLAAGAAQDTPAPLKPLLAATTVAFRLSPGRELEADLFLTFGTESARQAAARSANAALTLGQTALPVLIATLPKDAPDSLRVLRQTEVALKDVRVRSEGLRLHVPLRVKVDTATLASALEVLLRAEQTNRLRVQSASNLQRLASAMHDYEMAEGILPPAAIYSKDGKPLLSWRVALLPYLDLEKDLKFKLDESWDSAHNKKLLAKMPKIFRAPGAETTEPHGTF
jgi:RNA polymerase sigma factor (sigma-70 family)